MPARLATIGTGCPVVAANFSEKSMILLMHSLLEFRMRSSEEKGSISVVELM